MKLVSENEVATIFADDVGGSVLAPVVELGFTSPYPSFDPIFPSKEFLQGFNSTLDSSAIFLFL